MARDVEAGAAKPVYIVGGEGGQQSSSESVPVVLSTEQNVGAARNGFAITPHDTNALPATTRGLYVGVQGDVTLRFADATSDITLVGLAAGIIHPLAVTHVRSTGTTATDIVGVY